MQWSGTMEPGRTAPEDKLANIHAWLTLPWWGFR